MTTFCGVATNSEKNNCQASRAGSMEVIKLCRRMTDKDYVIWGTLRRRRLANKTTIKRYLKISLFN